MKMKHHPHVDGKIHIGFREYVVRCGICGEAEAVDYHDNVKQFIASIRAAGWRFIAGGWNCPDCAKQE
jgi:hypothetical protein